MTKPIQLALFPKTRRARPKLRGLRMVDRALTFVAATCNLTRTPQLIVVTT